MTESEDRQLRNALCALQLNAAEQERTILAERARAEDSRAELEAAHGLLRVITDMQNRFIAGSDAKDLFDGLLQQLVRITSSEYGFIAEVLFEVDGTPYLETRDLTDTEWNDDTRQRFRRLGRLFNRVVHLRLPVISNDPAADLRSRRVSAAWPGLQSFLGLPLMHGGSLVGVAGIVNRPGGYDQPLVRFVDPFLATCANLIDAQRAEARRKESDQARLDSEARIQAIVETAHDGILTVDDSGQIDYANPAVERMFGRPLSSVVHTPLEGLLPALWPTEHQSCAGAPLDEVVRAPRRETTAVRADGTTVPLEVVFSEMTIGGRRMFTGILSDISERKRVDRLKSEFVSTVSHELRTPLTSIRGSLGLLVGGAAGPMPVQAREMVAMALQNSERLGRLIDDILDIEKIASGQLQFRPRPVDLNLVVRRALDAVQGYAASHRIRLALVAEAQHGVVIADEERVTQVLANLISNASKFSPPGEAVEVEIAEASGRVRVSVRDRGPGIPEEFKSRIFQRFAQADGSDTRLKGGTGLGLSISKAIVERMNGDIGFEPNPEGGTTFFFELPVEPPVHAEPALQEAATLR